MSGHCAGLRRSAVLRDYRRHRRGDRRRRAQRFEFGRQRPRGRFGRDRAHGHRRSRKLRDLPPRRVVGRGRTITPRLCQSRDHRLLLPQFGHQRHAVRYRDHHHSQADPPCLWLRPGLRGQPDLCPARWAQHPVGAVLHAWCDQPGRGDHRSAFAGGTDPLGTAIPEEAARIPDRARTPGRRRFGHSAERAVRIDAESGAARRPDRELARGRLADWFLQFLYLPRLQPDHQSGGVPHRRYPGSSGQPRDPTLRRSHR